jgi:anti-sigma factor RsiW
VNEAERPTMGMHCERARELLPRYLDGELADNQAAPLRQHLLGCGACRAAAAEGRALSRWFEDQPVVVPAGFAERVVALAFGAGEGAAPPAASSGAGRAAAAVQGPEPAALRDFVLWLTAAAAVVLFGLSVALGLRDRPIGEPLLAEPLPQILEELDALNRAEALAPGLRNGPPAALPPAAREAGR